MSGAVASPAAARVWTHDWRSWWIWLVPLAAIAIALCLGHASRAGRAPPATIDAAIILTPETLDPDLWAAAAILWAAPTPNRPPSSDE